MRTKPVGMFVAVTIAVVGLLSLGPAHAAAAGADTWVRPVAGRVARGFHAPLTRYGAGHLGVDFAAPPGTAVRAAGAGTVVFAGVVANARHVVVRHAGGLRTSYSFLASISVHPGEAIARGAVLGTTGGAGEHHDGGVLHFGLRVGDGFVDPMQLFGPGTMPVDVHLAPLARAPGRSSRSAAAEGRALTAGAAGPEAPVLLSASVVAARSREEIPTCVRLLALRRPGRPGARCGPDEPEHGSLHWARFRTDSGGGNHPFARPRSQGGADGFDRSVLARAEDQPGGGAAVAVVSMKQLLEAGVHFGHQTRRWNPKMRRFIFGERNGIYIVDLHQTLDRIDTAYRFVRETTSNGGTVLFVGTKKQAQEPIENAANGCGMPYVNFRWLGGMLTNFQTVHSRVAKLREFQRQVDSGEVDLMSKKEGLKVRRDLAKLERNLGGIKNLEKLPSAVFIIDTKKEHIAVTEANRLRIPVVAIVDTNCDPDIIDYVIPGNDDAIRSAQLMCRVISDAVTEGREIARRRGARAGTRSDSAAPSAPAAPVKPQRTPEEQAEFERTQAEARDAAAAKQREIEERARLAKEAKPAPEAAGAAVDDAPASDAPSGDTTAAETAPTAGAENGEG